MLCLKDTGRGPCKPDPRVQVERKDIVGMHRSMCMCEREEYEEVARSVEHFATSILAQCRNSQEVSILCDVGKQAMI